jgi:hypothetical protein
MFEIEKQRLAAESGCSTLMSMTIERWLLRGTLALSLLAGCSKDVGSEDPKPQLVPTIGQSGQEGSCSVSDVEELPFDPAERFERTFGRHETRVRWREGEDLQPATFEVEGRGGPRVALRCGGSAFVDVSVHMQVPASGVNIEFEAVAQAWAQGDAVMISTTLDGDFKSTLRRRAEELANDWGGYRDVPGATLYYFDLWEYAGAISGHLVARRDREFCGMANWPEAYCDTNKVALPADTKFENFELSQAFEEMQAIGERTLTWPDATTTSVRFELERNGGPLCVGPYFPRGPETILDGTEIEIPARIRVVTGDGRVDAELPGKVMAVTARERGWQNIVRLEGGYSGPRSVMEAAGVRVPIEAADGALINANVSAERAAEGERGLISISAFQPSMAVERSMELRPNWQGRPLGCSSVSEELVENVQGSFGYEN